MVLSNGVHCLAGVNFVVEGQSFLICKTGATKEELSCVWTVVFIEKFLRQLSTQFRLYIGTFDCFDVLSSYRAVTVLDLLDVNTADVLLDICNRVIRRLDPCQDIPFLRIERVQFRV